MPIFESCCLNSGCESHKRAFEWYAHRGNQPDPPCESCGQTTRRCVSRFAAIWTKSLAEYGDPTKETYHKDLKSEGQVVARKRSHGGTIDKPVFERLDSISAQRAYCRDEGLIPPTEIGSARIDKSGKNILSNAGEPGVWV